MISNLNICKHLFGRSLVLALLASHLNPAHAQTVTFDTPLMVYAEKPLKVEDLRRRYGDKFVSQVVAKNWVVERKLQMATVFDFVVYKENDQGDLVEMTGYVQGSCDKVLSSYFQTLFPIQVAERGKLLPARASSSGIKIELPAAIGASAPFLAGQSIGLDFDKERSAEACTLTHTFTRKTISNSKAVQG